MATFQNQAILNYLGTSIASNTVSGQLNDTLTATKSAVTQSYGVTDKITYTVTLTNSGGTALTGLTLSDNLGSYTFGTLTLVPLDYQTNTLTYFVNGVSSTAPTVTVGPPMTLTGISIPAGGNVTLVYETRTNSYAPPGTDGSITNTITVSGDVLAQSVTAAATVAPEENPNLSITKSLSPSTVSTGQTLTYTFIVSNTGNTAVVETDNLTVTDTFNPILSSITVTLDGTTLTADTDYTYDDTTGSFATTAGVFAVPAATYVQNGTSGSWEITPGTATLVITGIV